MSYPFPPDLEQRIGFHLKSGNYVNEDEVIRDALTALERQQEEVAAIQEGIDDWQAGRTQPLRDFDRDLRQRKGIRPDA